MRKRLIAMTLSVVMLLSYTAYGSTSDEVSEAVVTIEEASEVEFETEVFESEIIVEAETGNIEDVQIETETEFSSEYESDVIEGTDIFLDVVETTEYMTNVIENIEEPSEEYAIEIETVSSEDVVLKEGKTKRFIIKYKDEVVNSEQNVMTMTTRSDDNTDNSAGILSEDIVVNENIGEYSVIEFENGVDETFFIDNANLFFDMEQVEYVQPDYEIVLTSYSEDEVSDAILFQLEMNGIDTSEVETVEEPCIVAVIDSGADISHPILASKVFTNTTESEDGEDEDSNGYIDDIYGWNFIDDTNEIYNSENPYDYNHGTHIAGIIAQSTSNVKILNLKVFKNGRAYTSDVVEAIKYADSMGAKVINCSFETDVANNALMDAVQNTNALFVCSAGNRRLNLDEVDTYPTAYSTTNVISVASMNADNGISYFSNYGANSVDIATYGEGIYSALPEGKYGIISGTSQATAFVSAVAGDLLATNDMYASSAKNWILECSDKLSSLEGKVKDMRKLNAENILSETYIDSITTVEYNESDVYPVYDTTSDEGMRLFSLPTTAISAGEKSSFVVKEDGSVWRWGTTTENGITIKEEVPTKLAYLDDVVKICSSETHTIALKSDGTVWGWGNNSCHQLGSFDDWYIEYPIQLFPGEFATDISVNEASTMIAYEDYVLCSGWGYLYNDQERGFGLFNDYGPYTIPVENVVKVSSGGMGYGLDLGGEGILTESRDLYEQSYRKGEYGSTEYYYLIGESNVLGDGFHIDNLYTADDSGFYEDRVLIESVENAGEIADISNSMGTKTLILYQDGSVYTLNTETAHFGITGTGTREYIVDDEADYSFTAIPTLKNIEAISCGASHYMAMDSDGNLYCWGDNTYGQCGNTGNFIYATSPVKVFESKVDSMFEILDVEVDEENQQITVETYSKNISEETIQFKIVAATNPNEVVCLEQKTFEESGDYILEMPEKSEGEYVITITVNGEKYETRFVYEESKSVRVLQLGEKVLLRGRVASMKTKNVTIKVSKDDDIYYVNNISVEDRRYVLDFYMPSNAEDGNYLVEIGEGTNVKTVILKYESGRNVIVLEDGVESSFDSNCEYQWYEYCSADEGVAEIYSAYSDITVEIFDQNLYPITVSENMFAMMYGPTYYIKITPNSNTEKFELKVQTLYFDENDLLAPQNLRVSELKDTSFRVTWDEVNIERKYVLGYKLYLNDEEYRSSYVANYLFRDMHAENTYNIKVSAILVTGDETLLSDVITVTTTQVNYYIETTANFDETKLTISGSMLNGANQYVVIRVFNPDNSFNMLKQLKCSSDGEFEYSYKMTEPMEGTYQIFISAAITDYICSTTVDFVAASDIVRIVPNNSYNCGDISVQYEIDEMLYITPNYELYVGASIQNLDEDNSQDILMALMLYNENGELVKYKSVSGKIAPLDTKKLIGIMDTPDVVTGYTMQVCVLQGKDVYSGSLAPKAESLNYTTTSDVQLMSIDTNEVSNGSINDTLLQALELLSTTNQRASYNPNFDISVSYYENDIVVEPNLTDNTTKKIRICITNNSDDVQPFIPIMATYKTGDEYALIGARTIPLEIEAGQSEVIYFELLTNDINEIKVMVWDSFENMTPLMPVYEINSDTEHDAENGSFLAIDSNNKVEVHGASSTDDQDLYRLVVEKSGVYVLRAVAKDVITLYENGTVVGTNKNQSVIDNKFILYYYLDSDNEYLIDVDASGLSFNKYEFTYEYQEENTTFLIMLNELERLAEEYKFGEGCTASETETELVLQYIRQAFYKDGSSVCLMLGAPNREFINFVNASKPLEGISLSFSDYFNGDVSILDEVTENKYGMPHFAATLEAVLRERPKSWTYGMGWMGDLGDIYLQLKQDAKSKEESIKSAQHLIGLYNLSGESLLSFDDLIADINAENVNMLYGDTMDENITNVFISYHYKVSSAKEILELANRSIIPNDIRFGLFLLNFGKVMHDYNEGPGELCKIVENFIMRNSEYVALHEGAGIFLAAYYSVSEQENAICAYEFVRCLYNHLEDEYKEQILMQLNEFVSPSKYDYTEIKDVRIKTFYEGW